MTKIKKYFHTRNLLKIVTDWRVIIVFVALNITASFVLASSGIIQKQINSMPELPKRIGPVYVRGIYISSWTAGESRINDLIELIERTELNAVVIDIKDSSGKVAYDSKLPLVNQFGLKELRIKDLPALIKKLKEKGIYSIARIVVFQDPELAKNRPDLALKDKRTGKVWQDFKGLAWLDPSSKEVWQYNVDLAQEALQIGFDEVNFDYIRFPSDGLIRYLQYPFWDKKISKTEVIKQFFIYQDQELGDFNTSVDLFGMTLWRDDGMEIGQKITDALLYFDYVCPMLYPSHFPENFENFSNPAEHPYEIIYRSLIRIKSLFDKTQINTDQDADQRGYNNRGSTQIQTQIDADIGVNQGSNLRKSAFIRPWLQAFDLGAKYTPEMILKQKQAVEDGGGFGWLLWNARNDYSGIENALRPRPQSE